MATTDTNNTDLARAEILWKSADTLRGQIDSIRGTEANLSSRLHLAQDSRTISAGTKKSESRQWR